MANFVNSIIRDVEERLESEKNHLHSIYRPLQDESISNSALISLGKIDAYQIALSILREYPHD